MPELPEVEMIARMLAPHLAGRQIAEVRVLWERTVARPTAVEFVRQLTGARIESVGRRGKYLLFPLDSGQMWLAHLRMSGHFLLRTADVLHDLTSHVRAWLRFADGDGLWFVNPRKFGRFYLVDDPQAVLGSLGPEPLAPQLTGEQLAVRLRNRRGEIKRLLLDQRFIAGLGNIYANEALWRAEINPLRVAGSLTEAEAGRLHAAIVHVLREAIRDGGTRLADRQYVYPDGGSGQHQQRLQVYGREGAPCPRCGRALVRIVQGGRSSYFCPACQPLPG